MKPKVKPASIPATDVPEQRLQHNGEVFNIHGGWLEEGGREGGKTTPSWVGYCLASSWDVYQYLYPCVVQEVLGRREMANRTLKLG